VVRASHPRAQEKLLGRYSQETMRDNIMETSQRTHKTSLSLSSPLSLSLSTFSFPWLQQPRPPDPPR